jgi:hypothetical protein
MLQDGESLSQALTSTLKIDPAFKLEEKLLAWIKDKTIVNHSESTDKAATTHSK